MKLLSKNVWLVSFLSLMLGAPLAQAEAPAGWYARLGVSNNDTSPNAAVADTITISGDSRETGFNVGWGYRFNTYFAMELNYRDLGEHRYDASCNAPPGDLCSAIVEDVVFDLTAVTVAGTASWPITDQVSVFGLLGIAAIDTSSDPVPLLATPQLDNPTELELGIGAAWQVTEELALDLRYSQLPLDEVDDIDATELGLIYSF